jgi:hypothetical protein
MCAFQFRKSVLICLILGSVLSGRGQAVGEVPISSQKAIGRMEQALNRAAAASPQWHQRQQSIQRDVEDITFLLQQSLLSSENPHHDRAGKQYYAQEALAVLHRATTVGHFDPVTIEPVLELIRRLLTD